GRVGRLRSLTRRDLMGALALGAVGYSAQAGCYFAALDRLDVSLLALVLYTYPAFVTVAAIALGRERFNPRKAAALLLASGGLVLVLAGAGAGALDPVGCVFGVSAALVYTGYILTSEGIAMRLGPLVLSALVCTGASFTLVVAGVLDGDLVPAAVTAKGWGWLGAIAVVSTVGAVVLFFAGRDRVGSTAAAILSTAEPPTTVLLAFVIFGESLAGMQLAGGALVLGAVFALSTRRPLLRGRRSGGEARGRGQRMALAADAHGEAVQIAD
ncbi:MAG: hypothetical protein QOF76_3232, partial [Solirubrobacteraceae bacterium]|nr:hypothetical protein [Solirubrobacteraceae bacterium]